MKKLLFFDIDGTLAYPGSAPSASTADAIRAARLAGHKVFLSTGRTIDSIPDAVMDIGFDGGIYGAGGYIIAEGQILSHHFMPDSLVRGILDLLQNAPIFYTLETTDGKFRSKNGKDILAQMDLSKSSSETQRLALELLLDNSPHPLSAYQSQPEYKIAFSSKDDSTADQLASALAGVAKVVRFDNLVSDFPLTFGEISDFSINKGIALQEVCSYYGMTDADCIAFGDSMNDAEILKVAGLGVAMGNAEERVKELADLVCDSCERDGIAKILRELNLIR